MGEKSFFYRTTKKNYRQVSVRWSRKREGKQKGDVGRRQERDRGGMTEEREVLSCMIGVSGRFLCDIQVEAWT